MTLAEDLTLWQKSDTGWASINFDFQNRGTRQSRVNNYIENGSIYIFKPEVIKKFNNRIGGKMVSYQMDPWQTMELDTIEDIDVMEFLFNKHKLGDII